jgi:choline dehydrogenase-like flavoprotein
MEHGARVLDRTAACRLVRHGDEITAVECLDLDTGRRFAVPCRVCVVSAGAIASPALLLSSGLGGVEPNGRVLGRYLMRHCCGIVIGLFPFATNPEEKFHKQVAITDFYLGAGDGRRPRGPWGMIQGLQVAPPEFIAAEAGFPVGTIGARTVRHQIYLMCIAEDLPQAANRVELEPARRDAYGLPVPRVRHRYCRRDLEARRALCREAGRILRAAGATLRVRKPVDTFSHVVGTCRFGDNPESAALDPWCRFFGVRNLFVVDGSFMPSSGGVNPSLTIGANALRVGQFMVASWDRIAGSGGGGGGRGRAA